MKSLVLVGVLLLAAPHVSLAQTITSPAGTVAVTSAEDYATRVLQDPWDMNGRTDLGWFTFGVDSPPSNLSNFSFTNGIFSATPTSDDSSFWLLDPYPPGTVQYAKDGKSFPIDGGKYKLLLIRMSLAQDGPADQQYGQVFWSNNTIFPGQPNSGIRGTAGFPTHKGWWIYAVDLSALGSVLGPAWPGTSTGTSLVDSFRFDPTQTIASGQIQVDWVRLVDNSNGTLSKTISWTGGASAYNIFLSNSPSCANASQIDANRSSGYQLYVGGLPAGDWYVGLGTGSSPTTCSSGFFRVAGVPTIKFTSPSEEGSSDDFATVQLSNPWDFDSVQDVDFYANITGLATSAIAAETEGGTSLGPIRVLSGTSTPATAQSGYVGDPYVYPLWSTLRGATHRIDTNRYRILTFEMSVPRSRDLFAGSIARIVWRIAGEAGQNVTKDIILHHLDPAANGGIVAMQKITFDLADRTRVPLVTTIDPSLSQSGWVGALENFRVDPHEFSSPTAFYLRRVKLAAFETADASYTINVSYDNPAGTAATLSLFDDADAAGFDGTAIPGCQNLTPSSSTPCVWNTSALPAGSTHFVYAVVSSGATVINRTYARWPLVISHAPSASVAVAPTALRFAATKAGPGGPLTAVTAGQVVTVSFAGGVSAWTATANQPWVQITNGSGSGAGQFTASIINPGNILGGSPSVSATITVSAQATANGPVSIPVTLTIDQSNVTSIAAFGQVDTPLQNVSGVVGAIGVTGWALDNVGVAGVRIYRNCLPFDVPASCQVILGNNVVLTGDATFVAGVRPDVEAAFSSFPQAYRAGWGFLLLTNMLPHVTNGLGYGGQGPLTLYVFATDAEGNITLLGRSPGDHTPTAITMANDTIAKPFGAIDTPGQGATVSGQLNNFGWVLTPDGNTTPDNTDILMPLTGSTMNVFIDGAPVGAVGYNNCRGTVGNPVPVGVFCNDDIASIFGNPTPQPTFTTRTANATKYRNLDAGRGAIGVFGIDTTALTNGLHSIAWGVTDSAGRVEGIGSRNFIVLNAGADAAQSSRSTDRTAFGAADEQLADAPVIVHGPAAALDRLAPVTGTVWGRTGFDLATALTPIPAGQDGVRQVGIPELGRLEVSLGGFDEPRGGPSPLDAAGRGREERRTAGLPMGFLVANGTLRDLPTGSHLDPGTGVFTWAPGPGFIGTYRLTFVRGAEQIPVDVTIRPAGTVDPTQGEVRMVIDAPATGVANGAVTIAGWALDPQSSIATGIDAVHVWAKGSDPGLTPASATPVFLGAATLGGARPDVAAAFGASFSAAGYSLTTSALAPGGYDVIVYVHSTRTGRWEDARTVTLTVR